MKRSRDLAPIARIVNNSTIADLFNTYRLEPQFPWLGITKIWKGIVVPTTLAELARKMHSRLATAPRGELNARRTQMATKKMATKKLKKSKKLVSTRTLSAFIK